MRSTPPLSPDQLRVAEAIARTVVDLVRDELGLQRVAGEDWIDSKEVARRFGVSRAWVYAHAGSLGAVQIGDGPKPRLRFIPSVVAAALQAGVPDGGLSDEAALPDGAVPIHVPRIRSAARRSSTTEARR
jgi:hypothetical protein